MFEQKLISYEDLPARETHRRCTDIICTIISSIFALFLFILACIAFNKNNLYEANYPTDSDGIPCGRNNNTGYSYIYLPIIYQIGNRVCVSSCPAKESIYLLCKPNSKIKNCLQINIYQTTAISGRLGGYCLPDDQQQKKRFKQILGLDYKEGYLKVYDTLRVGMVISLSVSVLYAILVQFVNKYVPIVVIVLAGLISIAISAICLFLATHWEDIRIWRIFLGIIFLGLGIYVLATLYLYRKKLNMAGTLLYFASQYLQNYPSKLLLIPLFLGFTAGLIILVLFQYIAFSSSVLITSEHDIYLHPKSKPFLTFLCIIEFIWGIQFLKDSYNFIISGNACEWYIRQGKLSSIPHHMRNTNISRHCCTVFARLVCFNWGSVVGGAFLNSFFSPINFIFELFRCYSNGHLPSMAKFSNYASYFCCNNLCDLIRTDTYTYINLTGLPYCNASRHCEALIVNSNSFIGIQSVLYFYRFCVYLVCVGISSIVGYFMINTVFRQENTLNHYYEPTIGSMIAMIVISYSTGIYFSDLHTNIGQAFQVSYCIEQQFGQDENERQEKNIRKRLQNELNDIENKEVEL